MNSVTNHHAGTKAGQFARCTLRSVLACALVFGASGAAFAQQYGDRQYDRRDDPSMQQSARNGERGARYLPPERDPRYDIRAYEEQRRAQQQQYQEQRQQEQRDNHRGGASGRMTPDERRDLRRQINEAGMDLYPPRR
jgi:hypothetical protein